MRETLDYLKRCIATIESTDSKVLQAAVIEAMISKIDIFNTDGGAGSGNWGHAGIPPMRGGSAPGGGMKFRGGSAASGFAQTQKNISSKPDKNGQRWKVENGKRVKDTGNSKDRIAKANNDMMVKKAEMSKILYDLDIEMSKNGIARKENLERCITEVNKLISSSQSLGEKAFYQKQLVRFQNGMAKYDAFESAHKAEFDKMKALQNDMDKMSVASKTDREAEQHNGTLKIGTQTIQQGAPMSFEEADNGKCNPKYRDGSKGYSTNCQTCVVAYEARLRGYDVEARCKIGNKAMKTLSTDTGLAWKDSNGNDMSRFKFIVKAHNETSFYSKMETKIQDGERYHLAYTYKAENHGHIVAVQKVNGEISIYDPQSDAMIIGQKPVTHYLAKMDFTNGGMNTLMRVDNLAFNEKMLSKVLKTGN